MPSREPSGGDAGRMARSGPEAAAPVLRGGAVPAPRSARRNSEETLVISVAPVASTRNARPFDWRITWKGWYPSSLWTEDKGGGWAVRDARDAREKR